MLLVLGCIQSTILAFGRITLVLRNLSCFVLCLSLRKPSRELSYGALFSLFKLVRTAAEEEMRKLQEELEHKKERGLVPSNKIDRTKMQVAEMAAELQSLQAGRGSNASLTGDGCLEALKQQLIALGANGIGELGSQVQHG